MILNLEKVTRKAKINVALKKKKIHFSLSDCELFVFIIYRASFDFFSNYLHIYLVRNFVVFFQKNIRNFF